MTVRFKWDEKKRHANLSKHGIDFQEAVEMFQSPMLVVADNREDYGEDRLIGVGLSKEGHPPYVRYKPGFGGNSNKPDCIATLPCYDPIVVGVVSDPYAHFS